MSGKASKFSIAEVVFSVAREEPKRLALLSEDFEVTYKDLANYISTYAHRLRKRGVNKNSFIALSIIDPVSIIASSIAASIIGCRFSMFSFVQGRKDIERVVTHVLHDNFRHNRSDENIICVGPWQFENQVEFSSINEADFIGHPTEKEIWFITGSSGSTGRPKAIGHTVEKTLRNIKPDDDISPGQIVAVLFKPGSSIGLHWILRVLNQQGTAVIGGDFASIKKKSPHRVVGSPFLLEELVKTKEAHDKMNSIAVSAGGMISKQLLELIQGAFEGMINRYGSAEIGHIASKKIGKNQADACSVGKPKNDIILEVVDEDDRILPSNACGIIRIKTESMVSGYLFGESKVTKKVFRLNWFYPGDTGYLNELGELFIVGRTDNRLNLGGFKISAERIEDNLKSIPEVVDCVAFSFNAENEASCVSVAIECGRHDNSNLFEKIRNIWCSETPLKNIPLQVFLIDKLPRNENGKLLRNIIAEIVQSSTGTIIV